MIVIGPYVTGEIPAPLRYTFLDDNGDPLQNTDGYTAAFAFATHRGTGAVERDADYDPDTATATFTWEEGDIDDAGVFVAEFTIEGPSNTFKSQRLVWLVRASVPVPAS